MATTSPFSTVRSTLHSTSRLLTGFGARPKMPGRTPGFAYVWKDLRTPRISNIAITAILLSYWKPWALSWRSSSPCSLVMTVQNSRYTTATSQ